MNTRSLSTHIVIPFFAVLLSGCTASKVANAWLQSKSGFVQCTTDQRILCEAGSDKLAAAIVPLLPEAIAQVEKFHRSNFTKPIKIYTYSSKDSFALHSASPLDGTGAVSLGLLHLSPKLLSQPERTRGILTHELSHLLLQDSIGSLAWGRIPGWFHEGLATFVSNGAGAENVSATEPLTAIRQGNSFTPDETQWILFPKTASSYGLKTHMFYRQSALFVQFMHDQNTEAFERMLKNIVRETPFSEAVENAYGKNLQSLWMEFKNANKT